MFIPIVPNTTIINKTIVYSDTVLPLKTEGKNIKVCCINNVTEDSLENCLETIFKSNPNVIFNTIQYSKDHKKVYFYTNETISTKSWEESKITTFKPINSTTQILEEFKSIFNKEKNKDPECISLYEVLTLIKTINTEYDNMKNTSELELKNIINSQNSHADIYIWSFNYNNNELIIRINDSSKSYKEIHFAKKNGDLFVTKSETYQSKNILALLGNLLTIIYDKFQNYKEIKEEFIYKIQPVNSIFLIDINSYQICIYLKNASFDTEFKLTSYSYNNKYDYDCNSNTVISTIQGKEDELFKRIFVKINDCPKWSQQLLYQIRQKQLKDELKKEKKLELKRKFFPWIKK